MCVDLYNDIYKAKIRILEELRTLSLSVDIKSEKKNVDVYLRTCYN